MAAGDRGNQARGMRVQMGEVAIASRRDKGKERIREAHSGFDGEICYLG